MGTQTNAMQSRTAKTSRFVSALSFKIGAPETSSTGVLEILLCPAKELQQNSFLDVVILVNTGS